MVAMLNFEQTFRMLIPSQVRNGIEVGQNLKKTSLVWYTDGAKMGQGVGVGIVGPNHSW